MKSLTEYINENLESEIQSGPKQVSENSVEETQETENTVSENVDNQETDENK